MRSVATRAALLALVIFVAGCGYFNSLYNAQQRFAAAERAEAAGSRATALNAYEEAIARAAVSYQNYPGSRWADDALLLIARARFARGEHKAAAAALERLLAETDDRDVRAHAHAYLGAARVALGSGDALAPLDSAVSASAAGSPVSSFSRLWRARARFAINDTAAAWQDLLQAGDARHAIAAEARVEALTHAVMRRDSVRWRHAAQRLLTDATPARWSDSVRALIAGSARHWSPAFLLTAMPHDAGASMEEVHRLRLRLLRADFLASAGDTAAAIDYADDIASASSLDPSSQARARMARWMLASADSTADLPRIRALLLPAFTFGEAMQMIRAIRAVEILRARAADEPIARFVAAEIARDELSAPQLARSLFLGFARDTAATEWAGKALLAARAVSSDNAERDEVDALLARRTNDIYVQAVRGAADGDAYTAAESTLRRQAAQLRAEAVALAVTGDLSVGRAVAVRDSIRAVLARDSLISRCSFFVDSIGIRGIRADSTRSACLRLDTARVRVVLGIDTAQLRARRDTTGAVPVDTVPQR